MLQTRENNKLNDRSRAIIIADGEFQAIGVAVAKLRKREHKAWNSRITAWSHNRHRNTHICHADKTPRYNVRAMWNAGSFSLSSQCTEIIAAPDRRADTFDAAGRDGKPGTLLYPSRRPINSSGSSAPSIEWSGSRSSGHGRQLIYFQATASAVQHYPASNYW